MKFSRFFFLILCCGVVLANASGRSIDFKFDASLRAESQYFQPSGFASVDVSSDNTLQLCQKSDAGTLETYKLIEELIRMQPWQVTAVEVCMKVDSFAASPLARLQWRWGNGKTAFLEQPIKADGKFQVYRFELSGIPAWDTGERGVVFLFQPCRSADAPEAAIEIKSFRFVLSARQELQRVSEIGDLRITALEGYANSAVRNKIELGGQLHEQLRSFRADFLRLLNDPRMPESEKCLRLPALEARYSKLYFAFSAYRDTVAASEELEDYRRGMRFNQMEIASDEELQACIERAREALKEGNWRAASAAAKECRQLLETLWETSPEQWQYGIGMNSSGRYAFGESRPEQGLLFAFLGRNRYINYNWNTSGGHPSLTFEPLEAEFDEDGVRQTETNWVFRKKSYRCRSRRNGRSIQWETRAGLTAPGFLLDTDVSGIRFENRPNRNGKPGRILAELDGRLQILSPNEFTRISGSRLTRNWLLLIPDFPDGAMPFLLTLTRKPLSVSASNSGIEIRWKKAAGSIGISTPWGCRTFRAELPDGLEKMAEQCEKINRIMLRYPIACDEYFKFSPDRRKVTVANVYRYAEISNEWGVSGVECAPLPPPAAMLGLDNIYVELPKKYDNPGMPSIVGPYLWCEGNRSDYTLQVPDLRTAVPVKTGAESKRTRDAVHFVDTFPFAKAPMRGVFRPDCSGVLSAYFDLWNFMNPEQQKELCGNARFAFRKLLEIINGQKGFGAWLSKHTAAERTDPSTGKHYFAYGWLRRDFPQPQFGDITNFIGFILMYTSRLAEFSGDISEVQSNWDEVRRFYSPCIRRNDWAVMGQDCMENTVNHTIDMGPDSWLGGVGMYKLAGLVGDRRMRDLALFTASKGVCPLLAAFRYRPYAKQYFNNFSETRNCLESGLSEWGPCGATRWEMGEVCCNFIAGCVTAPEAIRLYCDFIAKDAYVFEYETLERYFPDWINYRYRRPGYSGMVNTPDMIAQHFLLREALGEDTEKLREILSRGLCDDDQNRIWHHANHAGSGQLYRCAAQLAGREASCSPSAWAPALLLGAEYRRNEKRMLVRLRAAGDFKIDFFAEAAPDRVCINGKDVPFRFSKAERSLQIEGNVNGDIQLELFFETDVPSRKFLSAVRQENTLPVNRETVASPSLVAVSEKKYDVGEVRTIVLDRIADTEISVPADSGRIAGVPFRVNRHGKNGISGKTQVSAALNFAPGALYFLVAVPELRDEPVMKLEIQTNSGRKFFFSPTPSEGILWKKSGNIHFFVFRWNNQKEPRNDGAIDERQLSWYQIKELKFSKHPGASLIMGVVGEVSSL